MLSIVDDFFIASCQGHAVRARRCHQETVCRIAVVAPTKSGARESSPFTEEEVKTPSRTAMNHPYIFAARTE